ncbi:hypothetical protein [Ancylobacter vacuolatus]|uniref:Uncharacterized protein n=1 Tax=Ancylobacter vacuolatus TaxID=223389 RepID=A0ABU0DMY6_9HYPH|nr:hypothetical protein [Ancylobacter vacuolatus]MDQ0349719.1 hypothetical protein [Ancylobacter vacuolatus]
MNGNNPTRSSFDAATGRLTIAWPGGAGTCALEQWEAVERLIKQARLAARLDPYEGKWPAPPALPEV